MDDVIHFLASVLLNYLYTAVLANLSIIPAIQ